MPLHFCFLLAIHSRETYWNHLHNTLLTLMFGWLDSLHFCPDLHQLSFFQYGRQNWRRILCFPIRIRRSWRATSRIPQSRLDLGYGIVNFSILQLGSVKRCISWLTDDVIVLVFYEGFFFFWVLHTPYPSWILKPLLFVERFRLAYQARLAC